MSNELGPCVPLMTNLRSLCLGENPITPLESLSRLTQLTHLSFHGLTATSCAWVGALTNLHHLGLQSSELVNTGTLAGLAHLTQLASLELCMDLRLPSEDPEEAALRSVLARHPELGALFSAGDDEAGRFSVEQLSGLSALTGLTQLQLHGHLPVGDSGRVRSMLAPLSGLRLRVLRVWQDALCYMQEPTEDDEIEGFEEIVRRDAVHLSAATMAGLLPGHLQRALVNGGLRYDMGGQAYLGV